MSQSHTRFVGMDVHKETMAVAYVAQDHGAEVPSLGTIGTRPCASETRIRTRPSKAPHLLFRSEAGTCGSGLSRSLQNKGDACWGVAPSLMPQQAGARGQPDRRDAGPLARVARAGDRTSVSVPPVDDEAIRDLPRARDEGISARTDAPCRLTACVLRQDIRSAGRAHGGPAHLRWLADGVCPTPAPPIVLHA